MPKKPMEILTESMFYCLMALCREPMCGTQIAEFIDRGVAVREDEAALRAIGEEVKAFMADFPMPQF